MAEIVGSLFGVTPEDYQQARQAQADKMALDFAKLDPFESARFSIGRGAYGLAGALGGALGAEDPQLKLISQRNAIAKQIDPTNPESMVEGIRALSQAGDAVGAMQLTAELRKLQSEMAQSFQRTAAGQASLAQAAREQKQAIPADIAKATRIGELVTALQTPELDEMTRANLEAQLAALRPEAKERPAAAQLQLASEIANQKQIVDTLRNQPASPERDAALNRATYTLEGLERQLPQPKAGPLAKEIGVAKDTGAPVLLDDQGLFVYKDVDGKQVRTPFSGAIESKTPKTTVTVDAKQMEAFSQGRGKTQNELLTEATASARGASQALGAINNMKQLNDSGQLFTGPLANPAVGAANLLASVGLLSQDQVARLSKSEIYDKLAKDLVMQDLGGKLGGQISNADVKFIEARIPQLTTSVKARTELLDKLAEIQRGKIDYYQKMNAHANKFNNLNTFDFSQMYAPVAPSGGWSIRKVEPTK